MLSTCVSQFPSYGDQLGPNDPSLIALSRYSVCIHSHMIRHTRTPIVSLPPGNNQPRFVFFLLSEFTNYPGSWSFVICSWIKELLYSFYSTRRPSDDYNANNFVGALHRLEQFHNEHPEAAMPLMTGETTDLAGSLPEGRHTRSDAGGWQGLTECCQGSTEICMCSALLLLISKCISFLRAS
jgi:hypothetical protein